MKLKYALHKWCTLLLAAGAVACSNSTDQSKQVMEKNSYTSIALHGGAGNLKKMKLSPEEEAEYLAAMDVALNLGDSILLNGGTSEEAVLKVIMYMEDCPLFNAGKGSVFNHNGVNEMDAAIMEGQSLKCGAVTGVRHIKNPIEAAWTVMHKSEHVLLSGLGAEEFAFQNGVQRVDSTYFFVQRRWDQLQEALKEDKVSLDHDGSKKTSSTAFNKQDEGKYGTVGCVALDRYGNLCSGTSTGGLTNKKYGRIGDSPLIGAGTFANNQSCAVSCTGRGEEFIRGTIASDISARMMYLHESAQDATFQVVQKKLKALKGRGGCIVVDATGNVAIEYTTSGMFRAYRDAQGRRVIAIY